MNRNMELLNDDDLKWLIQDCRFHYFVAKRILLQRNLLRKWRKYLSLKGVDKPGAYMIACHAVIDGRLSGTVPPLTNDGRIQTTFTDWQYRIRCSRSAPALERIAAAAEAEGTVAGHDAARIARHQIHKLGRDTTPRENKPLLVRETIKEFMQWVKKGKPEDAE